MRRETFSTTVFFNSSSGALPPLPLDTIAGMCHDFEGPLLSKYYVEFIRTSKFQTAFRDTASLSASLGLTLALGWRGPVSCFSFASLSFLLVIRIGTWSDGRNMNGLTDQELALGLLGLAEVKQTL